MTRRRCIMTGLALTLAVALSGMTACQWNGNEGASLAGKQNAVSGTTVSADLIQEDFWAQVNEKIGYEERHFSHNSMVYYAQLQVDEDYEGSDNWILIQQGPDGSVTERYDIKELTAVWGIVHDWLYYVTEGDSEDTLWRIPIGKSEKGETLLLDAREKLVSMSALSCLYAGFYVSDSCLVFEGMRNEEEAFRIYKYDLMAKKCAPLAEGNEFAGCDLVFTSNHELAVFDGKLFLQTDRALYSIEPESGKVMWLMETDRDNYVLMEQCGGSIYITTDHRQVWRYDGGEEKPVCVMGKDKIQERLEELQLWGERGEYKDHDINAVYAYEDKLYLSVTADWGKEEISQDQWNTTDFILFHAGIGNIDDLRLEGRLWDYMRAMGDTVETDAKFPDDFLLHDTVYGPSMTGCIVEGKMVILGVKVVPAYVSSVSFLPCAAYDLKTGEIMENPEVKFWDGREGD